MSGDPFRAYYREVARQRRNQQIRRAIFAVLFVLGAFVVSVFLWALFILAVVTFS